MRVRPLALSVVVHAVLLALVAQVRRRAVDREEPIEIELATGEADVEPEPPAIEREPPDVEPESAEPAPRRAGRPRAAPAPRGDRGKAAGGVTGEPSPDGLDLGWSLGGLGGGTGGAGGAGGTPGGTGGGGRATRRARPAPRPASKARPPRLVYPRRVRDERDGDVFVAVVTVDEGGWVVGVRLVQGVSLYADQKALDAAWRLHYDPALDAAGRPIRARVLQRFMIE